MCSTFDRLLGAGSGCAGSGCACSGGLYVSVTVLDSARLGGLKPQTHSSAKTVTIKTSKVRGNIRNIRIVEGGCVLADLQLQGEVK